MLQLESLESRQCNSSMMTMQYWRGSFVSLTVVNVRFSQPHPIRGVPKARCLIAERDSLKKYITDSSAYLDI